MKHARIKTEWSVFEQLWGTGTIKTLVVKQPHLLRVGDMATLLDWMPELGTFTGRHMLAQVQGVEDHVMDAGQSVIDLQILARQKCGHLQGSTTDPWERDEATA